MQRWSTINYISFQPHVIHFWRKEKLFWRLWQAETSIIGTRVAPNAVAVMNLLFLFPRLISREGANGMYYHGSRKLVPTLKRSQAWGPHGTPKEESLNRIYFTPDFAFALVSAARPEGITDVNHNERTIHFENPDRFDPEKEVYIYAVDPSKIPDDKKLWVDERQVAVDLDEIKPDKVERHKAGEISRYYRIMGE